MPFLLRESKAGFMLYKLPCYFLPWSVPGGDGRIAGKALQIEQGNVRKLIANKIDLTLFPARNFTVISDSSFVDRRFPFRSEGSLDQLLQ